MIKYSKLTQEDMITAIQNQKIKALFSFSELKDSLFCILAKENEMIIGGISGFIDHEEASIIHLICFAPDDGTIEDGLIRSAIYILERMGVKMVKLRVLNEAAKKIGFHETQNHEYSISIQAFFKKRGRRCHEN